MAIPAEQLARQQGLVQPLRITTGITRGEMARILREAAVEANQLLLRNLAAQGGDLKSRQLRATVKGLSSLSSSMWGKIGVEVKAGIHDAAELAAHQQLDRDHLLGMPTAAIREYADGVVFNAFHHAESLISRRTQGYTLSERIYRNGRQGTAQAGKIVERHLARGASAREIASAVSDLYRPSVPGGQSYSAFRLGRTEINNAHHSTTIRLSSEQPWVKGYRWNLSGSHPRPDICDALALGSSQGSPFGTGGYTVGDVPSKPHPQCLCFLTILQADRDEFLTNLVGGKYDRYLGNLGVSGTFTRPTTGLGRATFHE